MKYIYTALLTIIVHYRKLKIDWLIDVRLADYNTPHKNATMWSRQNKHI